MAVKKIEELNIHRDVNSTEQFDVQGYLNENWDKMQDVVDNNAKELMQVQKDISTLKEDNKTNKSRIDVLEKSNETRDGKISKNTEDIEAIQGSIKTATETINKKDNEQDEDIKANKESIEELQAENLEIKAENERLREDIKSIATIGEASGENIHLEDSSDARCELEICGNHQQDTREGYNQFKITSTQTQSAGVTITKIDESSVSYQGTTTGMFTHMLVEYDGKGQKISKQMYLKAFGNLTNAILSVKLIKNGKTESSYLRVSPDLILSAGDVLQQIYVQQQNTGILISGTLQVLLTDYENKDKPYEQYEASPSILYPSEAKSVGDNVNYFDINSVTNSLIILESGNLYPNDSWRTTDFIEVKANIYTLSWESITDYFQCNIAFYDKDKKYLSYIQYTNRTFSNTFDVKNNAKYMRISYSVKSGGTSYTREKIKLETGNKRTEYSSYNCGSAKIDIFNKNYLSKIPKTSVTAQGITSTFDGQKFICKGTAQTNYFNLFTEKVYKKISKGIKTFSTNKLKKGRAFIHFDYVDGTGQNYYTSINTNQVRFTLNKDVESYRLNVDSITAGDTIDDNIYVQLEDGNIATEIVKAENQEFVVDVQQPMFENDTFMKQDAKWYEKHNWKTMSFDGQNMGSQAVGTFADFKENGNIVRTFEIKDLLISSVRNDIFCDKLPRQADSMWNGKSTGIQSWQGQNKILISLPFDDVEKKYGQKLTVDNYVTAFYMYLQDEVLIISYPLAEPILLECTKAQSKVLDEIYNKAHTYKNITNILAESAEVNPIICLKYLKDPETEHNKLQTQIDEIKQLLSTTETSAMLLNNMQTDLESEV
jgi:hypothetical protein